MDELLEKCISDVQNAFSGPKNIADLFKRAAKIMPIPETDFKVIKVQGTNEKIKAIFKVNLSSQKELSYFIKVYAAKNNETLRISKTRVQGMNSTFKTMKYYNK